MSNACRFFATTSSPLAENWAVIICLATSALQVNKPASSPATRLLA